MNMKDKQQTAVEWFANESWQLKVQLDNQEISVDEYVVFYVRLLYKAKEMEKEHIKSAFNIGELMANDYFYGNDDCAENYYKETYEGGNK